jgi:transketolase
MIKDLTREQYEIAEKDENAVMLIGDISHYLLENYEKSFPSRFYNLGICEQSLIGLAAGLSLNGMRPIVHTIAPFCVERTLEQIKIDLCYQNVDVTIVSVGSSFDYSHLGCTHHCYEDIAILRSLPNIQVFVPGSSEEFDSLLKQTWNNGKPKYFKLSSKEHNVRFEVKPNEHNIVQKGSGDKVVIVSGHLLDEVMRASSKDDTIIYVSTLSQPSDTSAEELSQLIDGKSVITIEENGVIGGLGDLIFDVASRYNVAAKIKKIGIPNKFLTNYGKPEEHREHLGLTDDKIRKSIME